MVRVIEGRALLAVLLVSGAAYAQEPSSACSEAYVSAQRLERVGKLVEARRAMLTCADASCPGAIQTDCVQWLGELRRKLPSAVFAVRDAGGRDLVDVRVLVDGALVASRIDGKPLDLDPGEHVVRFEPRGARAHELRVVMREGEQDRAIAVDLPAPPTHRPVPASVWITGALSLAALGTFGAFGAWGLADFGSLAYCKGFCAPSDVDAVNLKYGVADVALGVGVVLAVTSFVLFVTRPRVSIAAPLVGVRF